MIAPTIETFFCFRSGYSNFNREIDYSDMSHQTNFSFEFLYSAIHDSEAAYYRKQDTESRFHRAPPPEPDPIWVPTLAEAVKQFAPLPGGGVMSLKDLLSLLCIPATVGRSQGMLEMMKNQGIDWPTAFQNTIEEKQAASGSGKRTRLYERVKKSRQRVIDAPLADAQLPAEPAEVAIISELSSKFVADCVPDALDWIENGKPPGPLLRSLEGRFVAEALIADEAALSRAADFILREAALRFVALQCAQ